MRKRDRKREGMSLGSGGGGNREGIHVISVNVSEAPKQSCWKDDDEWASHAQRTHVHSNEHTHNNTNTTVDVILNWSRLWVDMAACEGNAITLTGQQTAKWFRNSHLPVECGCNNADGNTNSTNYDCSWNENYAITRIFAHHFSWLPINNTSAFLCTYSLQCALALHLPDFCGAFTVIIGQQ